MLADQSGDEDRARKNHLPEHTVTEHQRERVHLAFSRHVTKLVDNGVITFDDETITPAAYADQVLAALERGGASLDSNQEAHTRGAMDGQERDGGTNSGEDPTLEVEVERVTDAGHLADVGEAGSRLLELH